MTICYKCQHDLINIHGWLLCRYSSRVSTLVDQMIQVEPANRPSIEGVAAAALLARTKTSGSSSSINSGGGGSDAMSSGGSACLCLEPSLGDGDDDSDEDEQEKEDDDDQEMEEDYEGEDEGEERMETSTRSWTGDSFDTDTDTLRQSLMEVSLDEMPPPPAIRVGALPPPMAPACQKAHARMLRSCKSMPSLLNDPPAAAPVPAAAAIAPSTYLTGKDSPPRPPPPSSTIDRSQSTMMTASNIRTLSSLNPRTSRLRREESPSSSPTTATVLPMKKPPAVRRRHSISGPSCHKYSDRKSDSLASDGDFEELRAVSQKLHPVVHSGRLPPKDYHNKGMRRLSGGKLRPMEQSPLATTVDLQDDCDWVDLPSHQLLPFLDPFTKDVADE